MGKTMTQKVKSLRTRIAVIEKELKIAKQQLEHICPVDAVVSAPILEEIDKIVIALTEIKQKYVNHLCTENFSEEVFIKILDNLKKRRMI
jgi:phosphopantetheine adenylyltransferase